jgi:hypothetical protein
METELERVQQSLEQHPQYPPAGRRGLQIGSAGRCSDHR